MKPSKTLLIGLLLFSYSALLSQDTGKFGVSAFSQLSSTRYAAGITLEYLKRKNLFYIGAKIPLPVNDIYGTGIALGYGRELLGNETFKMYLIPDFQWLSSKTRNQEKRTHYYDLTLNYSLHFVKLKNISLYSSFGYGVFLKRFYRNDLQKFETNSDLSGLIRIGITYFIASGGGSETK
jgi:hypothetical protein